MQVNGTVVAALSAEASQHKGMQPCTWKEPCNHLPWRGGGSPSPTSKCTTSFTYQQGCNLCWLLFVLTKISATLSPFTVFTSFNLIDLPVIKSL